MTEKAKKFFSFIVDIEKAKGWQEYAMQAESKEQVEKAWTSIDVYRQYRFIDEEIEVQGMSNQIEITEITEEEYKARLRYL